MLKDPIKYMELLEAIAIEEKEMQEESLAKIKNASNDDLLSGLKWVGVLLGQIRINKGYSLRKFVLEKFKGEEGYASRISNIERGLDIPSAGIIKRYVDLLKENENENTSN